MEVLMSLKKALAAVGGLAMAATMVLAADQKIKQSDVPAPALKAIEAAYPGAKLVTFERETEDGKTLYEIGIDRGGKTADVIVTGEGTIVVEEALVALKDVPEAVQAGLASSAYGKLKVVKVEKLMKPEAPNAPEFEIVVQDGAKKRELLFTAAGQLKK
jgi:hypothetical protein